MEGFKGVQMKCLASITSTICKWYADSNNHKGITVIIEAVSLLQSTTEHGQHVLKTKNSLVCVILGQNSSTRAMTTPILLHIGSAQLCYRQGHS